MNQKRASRGRGRVTPVPPHRSRRAAFPHRAPVEGPTRSKLRGVDDLCSSDPQAHSLWDMPSPALCPGHAALLTFPSTGRLPSTISAADMSRHCSRLHRYYAAVRLLASSPAASSPRLPDVTRVRRSGFGRGEVSQVPTRSFPA
jgi:hypothetical protein